MNFLNWMKNNYGNILMALSLVIGVAEVITRMTPTTKDDTAVERVGKILKSIMGFLKIPNNIVKK